MIMLVKDIFEQEINVGDDVILSAYDRCYKMKIIKETRKSIGTLVYKSDGSFNNVDNICWTRKNCVAFRNMYKIC